MANDDFKRDGGARSVKRAALARRREAKTKTPLASPPRANPDQLWNNALKRVVDQTRRNAQLQRGEIEATKAAMRPIDEIQQQADQERRKEGGANAHVIAAGLSGGTKVERELAVAELIRASGIGQGTPMNPRGSKKE